MSLKEEFMKLLEKDLEFRYAVAGYLGLSEMLRRLDSLAEEQNKLRKEIKELRESQNKLWEEVRYLRLGRAVGRTLEDYVMAFVKFLLEDMDYPKEKIRVRRKLLVSDGEVLEINVFNEDPLVVGEVTTYVGTVEEARGEVEELLKRVRVAEEAYKRKSELRLLAVANAPSEVVKELRKLAKMYGVRFVYGRELLPTV